jgi:hypothetical protein
VAGVGRKDRGGRSLRTRRSGCRASPVTQTLSSTDTTVVCDPNSNSVIKPQTSRRCDEGPDGFCLLTGSIVDLCVTRSTMGLDLDGTESAEPSSHFAPVRTRLHNGTRPPFIHQTFPQKRSHQTFKPSHPTGRASTMEKFPGEQAVRPTFKLSTSL